MSAFETNYQCPVGRKEPTMHNHTAGRMLLCLMVMAALFPQLAFAQQQFTASSTADYKAAPFTLESIMPGSEEDEPLEGASVVAARAVEAHQEVVAEAERANKVLAYDPAAIEQIGNQLSSGHSICCPSFSCAYADAVLDGTIHDHSYYCCYGSYEYTFFHFGFTPNSFFELYLQIRFLPLIMKYNLQNEIRSVS